MNPFENCKVMPSMVFHGRPPSPLIIKVIFHVYICHPSALQGVCPFCSVLVCLGNVKLLSSLYLVELLLIFLLQNIVELSLPQMRNSCNHTYFPVCDRLYNF